MQSKDNISKISDLVLSRSIDLPEKAGIYAFWWIGQKSELMGANRQIVLKGPGGKSVSVEYQDWWPEDLVFPCLYVGKSTNIKKRFSLHLKRKSLGRLHEAQAGNVKAKPKTTSCQLRFGIEHIFPQEPDPLKIIYEKVGFSFSIELSDEAVAERFFKEDRLIGTWKPWFNVDSER